jgi:hypothetical protein
MELGKVAFVNTAVNVGYYVGSESAVRSLQ